MSGTQIPDNNTLSYWQSQYLESIRMNNYSPNTVYSNGRYIGYFVQWCGDRELHHPEDITPPVLERYRRYLYHYRTKTGQPLKQRTQLGYLVPVRALFRWLTKRKVLVYNPAAEIELPRPEHHLPKDILKPAEVELVINQVDITEPLGLRDRALLEVLYSTGLRRAEVTALTLNNVDYDQGMVMVRQGKGRKDRCIPIGDRALAWLHKYLSDRRPYLKYAHNHEEIFLSVNGLPMHNGDVARRVRHYVKQAELGKEGACHMFRHSMATAMLDNGADIRHIQLILGHASLKTTQIYTQVSNRALKDVHSKTHPARLEKEENEINGQE